MKPPSLALWLLARLLTPEMAEAVTGDLTEEYGRRADRSPTAARLWFWRQTCTSIWAARRPRRGDPDGSTSRPPRPLTGLSMDVRVGLRALRRAPVFTLTAIATLAIGIGAATAIGTAAHRVLLRPLPYPHGDRLVTLGHPNDDGTVGNVGFATVVDWRARLSTFDELAIVRGWSPTLVAAGGATRVDGMRVNWNFFRMLGVRPAMGRDFEPGDDKPDRNRVAIVSDAFWRRELHARPDVIGSSLELYGRPIQIVGVLPASYEPLISERLFTRAEIWAPLGYDLAGDSSCRSCQHLRLLGRLRDGATLRDAMAEAATVHADLRRQFPADYQPAPPVGAMFQDEMARSIRGPLQILVAAVLFVLLVSSTNVAGLLMARAADRQGDLALRAALGAGRGRLLRPLLIESMLLAIAAAVLGGLLARWGLMALAARAPAGLPGLDRASSDPALLTLSIGSTAAALIAFGLLPAWTTSHPRLEGVLHGGRHSADRRSLRAREWLIVAQIAVALLLVAGAGLMHRTVSRLLHVDPGFDAHGVLSAGLSLVGPAWAEDAAVRSFQETLLGRVRTLPGVEHAALAGQIPLGGNYDRRGFHLEGRTYATEAEAPSLERYSVTPDYFATMRIPVREGRTFTGDDRPDGALVLVVNETAARQLWPGARPIGARVRVGDMKQPPRTVVGVVGDVRHYALAEPPAPQFYAPQQQLTDSFVVLVIRTTTSPGTLAAPVRKIIGELARDVAVYDIATLDQRLERSISSRTFLKMLLGLFALTALVIAAVGLYGVVSQGVGARRREFSIRVALGAARRDITWLAARRGLTFAAAGIAIGLIAATMAGTLLRTQLYDTAPTDPATLAASAAALLSVALLAHVGPIRRAVRADPAATLKGE